MTSYLLQHSAFIADSRIGITLSSNHCDCLKKPMKNDSCSLVETRVIFMLMLSIYGQKFYTRSEFSHGKNNFCFQKKKIPQVWRSRMEWLFLSRHRQDFTFHSCKAHFTFCWVQCRKDAILRHVFVAALVDCKRETLQLFSHSRKSENASV